MTTSKPASQETATVETQVEHLEEFSDQDLTELCEATAEAIVDGEGFGWLKPPPVTTLEAYWKGVLLVPERDLFVARLQGSIVGTTQLLRPRNNNEAGAFAAEITAFFIAPWARGHGLARGLLRAVENHARALDYTVLELDVRADRSAAISLFENAGFRRWATKERYSWVKETYIPGYFYVKYLDEPGASPTVS